jgi:phosphatidylserine/phosphatidylglycerophosphate/cardiolipin synthase-like enzyme
MDNLEVSFSRKMTIRNMIWDLKKKNLVLNKKLDRKVIARFDITVNFIFGNIIREKQMETLLFEFEFRFFKRSWTIRRTFEDFRNLLRKVREKDPELAENVLPLLIYNGESLSELLQTVLSSRMAIKKINFIHHFIEFSFITISGLDEKIYKQTYIEKKINTKKQSIFQKMICCDMSIPRWLVITSEGIGYATRNNSNLSGFREFSYFFKKINILVNHRCHLEILFEMRKLKVVISKDLVFLDTLDCLLTALLESPGLTYNRFGSFSRITSNNSAKFYVNGSNQQKENYFSDLYDRLIEARHEVFINDWFFSPHIFLKRPIEENPDSRLDKVLKKIAKKGVNIYIILYKEIDLVLYNKSAFVKTYLNRLHKNIRVVRHRSLNELISAWSHHEKMCIIDSKYVFMGGLDLAFGRTELPEYPLQEPMEKKKNKFRKTISTFLQRMRREIIDRKRMSLMNKEEDIKQKKNTLDMNEAKQLIQNFIIGEENEDELYIKEKQMGVDRPDKTDRRDTRRNPSKLKKNSRAMSKYRSMKTGSKSSEVKTPKYMSEGQLKNTNSFQFGKNSDSESERKKSEKQVVNMEFRIPEQVDESQKTNNPFLMRPMGGVNEKLSTIKEDKEEGEKKEGEEEYLNIGMDRNYREMMDTTEKSSEMSFSEVVVGILERVMSKIDKGEKVTINIDILEKFKDHCPMEIFEMLKELNEIGGRKRTYFFGQDYYNTRLKDFHDVDKWNFCLLDKYNQPRMPWRDIAVQLEGAIVSQMKRHFLKFWNFTNIEFGLKKATRRRRKENKQLVIKKKRPKVAVEEDFDESLLDELYDDGGDDEEVEGLYKKVPKKRGKVMYQSPLELEEQKNTEHRKKQEQLMHYDPFRVEEGEETYVEVEFEMEVEQERKVRERVIEDGGEEVVTLDQQQRTHQNRNALMSEQKKSQGIVKRFWKKSQRRISEFFMKDGVKYSREPQQHMSIHEDQYYQTQQLMSGRNMSQENSGFGFLWGKRRMSSLRGRGMSVNSDGFSDASRDIFYEEDFFGHSIMHDDMEMEIKSVDAPNLNMQMHRLGFSAFEVVKDVGSLTCQGLRSSCRWSLGLSNIERSIYLAYIWLIENSKHFILIENQFFISSTGGTKVKNKIADTLAKRICRAIDEEKPFLTVILIPLLPGFEGDITAKETHLLRVQVYWHLMTIYSAKNSLFNQVVRHFRRRRAERLLEGPNRYFGNAERNFSDDAIFNRFVKIYGLRNHDEIKGRPVTELIYIHSKLIIVDDQYALLGSANINDRSLLGNRDSELAMFFEDSEKVDGKIAGKKFVKSPNIRDFRINVLKSIAQLEVDYEDPLNPTMWKSIDMQASINTDFYKKVFHVYPCDSLTTLEEVAKANKIPCDTEFYFQFKKDVLGFMVHWPYKFLSNEKDLRYQKFVIADLVVKEEVYI